MKTPNKSILLVEDHQELAETVGAYLEASGYIVDYATDGLTAMHLGVTNIYEAIVLDVMLPGVDGLTVCKRLRDDANVTTPIIMLTARDQLTDKLKGFESGADDYLIKPFDSAELKARIRALLRRSAGRAEPLIQLRGVTLDPQSQQVTFEGKPVNLSRKEFVLLHELMAQPDRVLTRDRLEQSLYGWNEEVDSNTLEVHIHHLRRKLFSGLIRTLRGVGYMIERDA